MRIKKIVDRLRHRYQTCDPFEMASCMGAITLIEPMDVSIRGFYHFFQRNRIIYVNNILESNEQRIVCAHELGHAVLHKDINSIFMERSTFYITDKYETEADIFAVELLLPDDLLNAYPTYYNVDQIASSEQLPPELIKLKLRI